MATETTTQRGPAFAPAHPGEILREDVLPALGMSKAAFGVQPGISQNTLYKLLNEQLAVTLAVAVRLALTQKGEFPRRGCVCPKS